MKPSYWRICGVAAVLIALAYVARPLWAPGGSSATPYAEAGAVGGIISFNGVDDREGKTYIIDTQSKVILVYAASNGVNSFNMVAGRSYASDLAAFRANWFTYNQRGYSVQQMTNAAGGGGAKK